MGKHVKGHRGRDAAKVGRLDVPRLEALDRRAGQVPGLGRGQAPGGAGLPAPRIPRPQLAPTPIPASRARGGAQGGFEPRHVQTRHAPAVRRRLDPDPIRSLLPGSTPKPIRSGLSGLTGMTWLTTPCCSGLTKIGRAHV